MRNLTLSILSLALTSGNVMASQSLDIQVNGTTRTFYYYVPDGLKDNAPLAIVLHGAQGNGNNLAEGWGWDSIANREKIVVATPSSNGQYWDLGGTSDVDFVRAVIDEMATRFNIDRNRVYATGWSMGGMLSYYLACLIPDKIAAIGPSSGYPIYGQSGCTGTRPVPIHEIHGEYDDFVKFSDLHGFLYNNNINDYGCPTTPDSSTSGINGLVTREYWGPCQKDGLTSEITLCTWWKAHSYGSEESEVMWNFLKGYSLTDPVPPSGVFYQYGNFHGRILRLVPGSYPHYLLNKVGLMDNAVASLRVDPGATIEFFDNDNFQNPLATYTSDVGDLSSIKDKITAIRVSTGPVITVPAHRDTIFNSKFNLGTLGWTFNVWGGGAHGSVVNGEYKIQIDSIGQHNSAIQLIQNGIILEEGKSYEVKFDAYASANRTLEANVEQDVSPWISYLPALQNFDLKTNWTPYSYTFTMKNPTDSNGRVTFNVGASTETVFLDNISITAIPTGIGARTGSQTRRSRWSAGVLLLAGTESGKLQIIDTRGRSRIANVNGGMAYTGSLPAGIYQARFLDGKQGDLQRFTVLP